MALAKPPSPEKAIRKIDIAQVSLSLQDRLGLAKVKYQNGRLPVIEPRQNDGRYASLGSSERPSDSSSEISRSRCETPLTSPPLRTSSAYSKELPRSARNKHAVTFNSKVMQPMLSASRKRLRSDSITERPAKAPRVSWKSSYQLPESSPGSNRHRMHGHHNPPFVSHAATIPELSSPAYHGHSDDDDLPVHSFQHAGSMVASSPPRTPPPRQARLPRNERALQNEDGADLLLYLANSPTPASISKPQTREFPPSTPPSQHAVLPGLTPIPNFGTPGQQFNFADFVNVTPSPAQPAWGGRTPGGPSRTPLATKEARKRLNFDNLVPPGVESPRTRGKETGLALQLGGELRP